MTQNKHKILFIDDELELASSRKELVDSLNKDYRLEVEAHHPVDIIDQLALNEIKDIYSLIIIDYKLNTVANAKGKTSTNNGYSLTSIFKERYPGTPVYLISQILEKDVSIGEHYDKMISHGLLTKENGRNMLFQDCEDYCTLKNQHTDLDCFEKIAKYLGTPDDDIDTIRRSLPLEFKNGLKNQLDTNSSTVIDEELSYIRLAKWINSKLLKYSGPLINTNDLAIMFGVKFEFIQTILSGKHSSEIEKFRYKGPFHHPSEFRWWSQAIFNFSSSIVPVEHQSMPWVAIPDILEIEQNQRAICVVCKGSHPECIGFDTDDVNLEKPYPAHWRCTTVSESYNIQPGFNPVFILDEM